MTASKTERLYYVDYLRVALTVLVIAHHVGQAYGPTGGAWPITDRESSRLLSPFFAVNPMFLMGLFLLAAGYFVPMAFDRKGTGMVWLAIGLVAAAGYYVYDLIPAQSLPETVAVGGKSWRSPVFCTWEAVVCAGLGVGLLVLFRERLNGGPASCWSLSWTLRTAPTSFTYPSSSAYRPAWTLWRGRHSSSS